MSRGGELVVGAGDRHRGMLCLPGVSHCACHHLLQSHQEVSIHPALAPEGTQTGLRAPPPSSIRFCFEAQAAEYDTGRIAGLLL